MSDAGGDSSPRHKEYADDEPDGEPAKGGRGRSTSASNGNKKRRTRNDGQMEMNRLAQQKYR